MTDVKNTADNTEQQRLDELRTSSGAYAMLAMDQRESLRGMFSRRPDGSFVGDEELQAFKADAVRILSRHASGILLDRPFGLPAGRPADLYQGCGLIVAADVLHQQPGELMTHSTVDPLVTPDFIHEVGAVAIKFLILWRPGEPKGERRRILDGFFALAEAAGVPTLLEGVVRTDHDGPWDSADRRHAAILEAAAEFAEFSPDLYKAEVPGYSVGGDVTRVADQARLLSEIVGEWVVLSNGVEPEHFASALTEAVRGGAHGFLAGRAVWQDIINEPDRDGVISDRGVARLELLRSIADDRDLTHAAGEEHV